MNERPFFLAVKSGRQLWCVVVCAASANPRQISGEPAAFPLPPQPSIRGPGDQPQGVFRLILPSGGRNTPAKAPACDRYSFTSAEPDLHDRRNKLVNLWGTMQ